MQGKYNNLLNVKLRPSDKCKNIFLNSSLKLRIYTGISTLIWFKDSKLCNQPFNIKNHQFITNPVYQFLCSNNWQLSNIKRLKILKRCSCTSQLGIYIVRNFSQQLKPLGFTQISLLFQPSSLGK